MEQTRKDSRAKHLPDTGNPRILLVAPTLSIMGGQAVQADRLLARMRRDGRRVDLLPINPTPPGFLRHAVKVKYLRTLVVSFFYILSLIKRIPSYDLIHVFSASYFSFILAPTPAILIARFYGKPVILNYRSGEAEDHLTRWGEIVFPIIRLVDKIVVPSGYLVEVFAKFGFTAEAIPNVVDDHVAPYRLRTEVQPKIIVARALEPLYNIACAIRAYELVKEKYPRAEMTILGYGSEERDLKAFVRERRLAGVTFAGRVERDEIGAYYDSHDLFLNSSSIDNMPVSILEAFAAGLPIVTTDAGGIPFIIEDRVNGHMVPINNHVALAERIIELIERPEEVRRLSEIGAREIKKYRWPALAGRWRDMYAATIRAHNTPRNESSQSKIAEAPAPGNPDDAQSEGGELRAAPAEH